MKKRELRSILVFISLFLSLCVGAFGQEITGSIDITVKDSTGAVVPNVPLTIVSTSGTAGFRRNVTTDDSGFQRVLQVPPGVYSVTAAATSGFSEKTVTDVTVTLGKAAPVVIEMGTGVSASVTVSDTDAPLIDTTSTTAGTNITSQVIELLPKGTNFSSALKIAPSTRGESKAGGFQIDGASGSENVYIIDGQEVTNVLSGQLTNNQNLPFQLIQEIQVKASSFAAEYGGATGGVVSVVTKGGGDRFHGEAGFSMQPSTLSSLPSPTLFQNPGSGDIGYYPSRRDDGGAYFPSGTLSGPIIKRHLWFFAAYTPQIFDTRRTLFYQDAITGAPISTQRYHEKTTREYAFGRIDVQPFQSLRASVKYTWNPIVDHGGIPGYTSELLAEGSSIPTNGTLSGADYFSTLGGRYNSNDFATSGVWIPKSWLTVSAIYGTFFENDKLGTYGVVDVTTPRLRCSTNSPTQFPAGFGCLRGYTNGLTPFEEQKLFDVTKRRTFDGSATVAGEWGGRHEVKGGYQYFGVANSSILMDRGDVLLRYGQTVAALSGHSNVISQPNAVGAGVLTRYHLGGDTGGSTQGLFLQDSWQPVRRLTVNFGARVEEEDIPSFIPGGTGVKFNWFDKFAPRIGAIFDITGKGTTTVSGFYGWFFDRFKYQLPRREFGGEVYRQSYFEILAGQTLADFATEAQIVGNAINNPSGCPNTGFVIGIVRCEVNQSPAANTQTGPVEITGGIDPDIKPFRQDEVTFNFQHIFKTNYLFAVRYTHKDVHRAVEDIGFQLPEIGYIVGNPGEGSALKFAELHDITQPKAKRQYDALEIRLDRRFANNYYFNASYTYGRLFGNYSGLASSDEEGRAEPGIERFFDDPITAYTGEGKLNNGRLATDRPHVFKLNAAYVLDWNERFGFGANHSTDFEVFQVVQSGVPLTTVADLNGDNHPVVVTHRGDLGRTPTFSQTDFAIRHRIKFGHDGRFTLVGDVDVLNLWNQHTVTNRYNYRSLSTIFFTGQAAVDVGLLTAGEAGTLSEEEQYYLAAKRFQTTDISSALLDALDAAPDPFYKRNSGFQGGRTIRFGVRFQF